MDGAALERCAHPYLFAIDRQRRLCFRGLHTLVEDIKAIAGFAGRENIKPHSLRHWRATDLMRAGADLRSVQAFLGHTQLTTTAIYLHTDEEQLRNISELTALRPQAKKPEETDNVIHLPLRDKERTRRRIARG